MFDDKFMNDMLLNSNLYGSKNEQIGNKKSDKNYDISRIFKSPFKSPFDSNFGFYSLEDYKE